MNANCCERHCLCLAHVKTSGGSSNWPPCPLPTLNFMPLNGPLNTATGIWGSAVSSPPAGRGRARSPNTFYSILSQKSFLVVTICHTYDNVSWNSYHTDVHITVKCQFSKLVTSGIFHVQKISVCLWGIHHPLIPLWIQWRRNYGDRGYIGHCTPQVQDLYPLYPPSQRRDLCQNFKQTTLATRLYKVRTNLYLPPHLRKRSDAPLWIRHCVQHFHVKPPDVSSVSRVKRTDAMCNWRCNCNHNSNHGPRWPQNTRCYLVTAALRHHNLNCECWTILWPTQSCQVPYESWRNTGDLSVGTFNAR